ncbi:MAG: putative DNA binding domain-containing protein [Methanoculleus marisnigri]|nr:putative DNA binding domain-containing protein [Methanoculleus marisnigri]
MIDHDRLLELIASGEAFGIEFKSDRRRISDREIYEEVVAMANTLGGVLLIGVEDDGQVTGASPRHGTTTDPLKLQSAIFNNTVPNINARISLVADPNGEVLAIEVDSYPEPCATTEGKAIHRTIKADGKPQTVPFYPRDQRSRRVDLGLLDFSSQVMDEVSFDGLDPLEFERLRQTVSRLRGDRSLLELSDEEIAKALRLVETKDGQLIPNVAGLLILGREDVIRNYLPTHEVHFQVLDAQGNVKVNDAFRWPLLRLIQEIEARFVVRNQESEIAVGFFRVPVPDYSLEGFREAFNNAILHRDYTRLDSVYVQLHHDHILMTNPGGFPAGITVENILVHEPKPRNPRLAEAFKRIGIIEQTGRGVDKIYMGQLRYGRPAPDYTRSDADSVRIVLHGGKASLEFSAFVYEQDKHGSRLSLDELMILNALFFDRRIDSEAAGRLIQKGATEARRTLEHLHEKGLVEGRGEARGRVYHLSADMYRRLGQSESYVRTHGIAPIRQEAMVMEYVQAHGRIERKHVMELCGLKSPQAGRILKKMVQNGKLKRRGTPPRWTYYVIAEEES